MNKKELRWLIKWVSSKTGLTGPELVEAVVEEIEATEFLSREELKEVIIELHDRITGL